MTDHYRDGFEGRETAVEAKDGLSIMEALRPLDIGIEGECEGSVACATCHVWIDQEWIDRLDAPPTARPKCSTAPLHVRATYRGSVASRCASSRHSNSVCGFARVPHR